MNKTVEHYLKLTPHFGIGLAVVAIAVAAILYIQRGAHVELVGSILKVRTLALDENSSAAILDFRVTNPSDYPFIVRTVDATLVGSADKTLDGVVISEVDARRLFEYFPVLGQKFNPSLTIRTKIDPHETMDRMLAVRFDIPEAQLQARKDIRLRIEEIDGPVSTIGEKKQRRVLLIPDGQGRPETTARRR